MQVLLCLHASIPYEVRIGLLLGSRCRLSLRHRLSGSCYYVDAEVALPFGKPTVTLMQLHWFCGALEPRSLLCCCRYVFNSRRWY
ncbi:hypothetical protein Nepgr_026641 [Nepenthes gracilis]|uniref:Uncharacterized protein n=1 Tax=Nepenthes gracilis TaxID=150966 RepID=A0AAD3T7K1_NEPGR|nr:hypothetical protein Nepgr_026641 [Nepenthes gracilis]